MHELQLAKLPTNMADCQPKASLPELNTRAPVLLVEKMLQNSVASVRLQLLSTIKHYHHFKSAKNKGKTSLQIIYRSVVSTDTAGWRPAAGVVVSITLKGATSTDYGPGTP
jgi:hypothetical protein